MTRVTLARARKRTLVWTCTLTRARTHARTRSVQCVYIVRNNEEFAQTGIPTFFKQGEQGQTVLYGRMDKHTQPRITHRAPPPSPRLAYTFSLSLRLSSLYVDARSLSPRSRVRGAYTRALAHGTKPLQPLPPRKLSTITLAQQAP